MKKIFCVFIAAVMCVLTLGISASAAGKRISCTVTYGGGYTYVRLAYSGAKLYYTTNGRTPDKNSKQYTGKFKVTKPVVLKVAAYSGSKRVASRTVNISVRTRKPTVSYYGETSNGKCQYIVETNDVCKIVYTTNGTKPSSSNGKTLSGEQFYMITTDFGSELRIYAKKTGCKASRIVTKQVPEQDSEQWDDSEPDEESSSWSSTDDDSSGGSSTLQQYRDRVLELVNEARAENGLTKLKFDAKLTEAAQERAEELLQSVTHTRPDGSRFYTVLDEHDVSYGASGENIAAGMDTPEEVVERWLNSEGHRKNILNSKYTKLGVGVVFSDSGYGTYWSQIFIS